MVCSAVDGFEYEIYQSNWGTVGDQGRGKQKRINKFKISQDC